MKRHDLLVISDEIHADFIFSGHQHISIASLDEDMMQRTITAYAPSKTFNLAGLCQSYVVIPNERLRIAYMAMYDALDLGSTPLGPPPLPRHYTPPAPWPPPPLGSLATHRP